jgi:hypothetical protein
MSEETKWYSGITEKHFDLAVQDAVEMEREAYSDLQKRTAEMVNYWTKKVERLEEKLKEYRI